MWRLLWDVVIVDPYRLLAEFLALFVGVWLVWISFCIDFLILILLVILFLFLNGMCYCFGVNILVFCFQE